MWSAERVSGHAIPYQRPGRLVDVLIEADTLTFTSARTFEQHSTVSLINRATGARTGPHHTRVTGRFSVDGAEVTLHCDCVTPPLGDGLCFGHRQGLFLALDHLVLENGVEYAPVFDGQ